MPARQKLTALVLFILGLVYFAAFILPNLNGADDERMLAMNSQDESFQYPFLMHMITPGKDAAETRWRLISYGHYIYGYPFYVASALSVLPLRMALGEALPAHTQTILVVLRQTISVLPMILSIGLLTYLVTRFRQVALAIGMFAFLLTIPGVVRQNIWWWHPDALSILCVILTFFFLDRDRLRYGRNFFLAALFCGLAASIKSVGFFFAPAVAGYLLAGLIRKQIDVRKAVIAGLIFIGIMFAAFVLSNPLFFWPEQRARIIQVRIDHNYYFTHGWEDSDPYATGLEAWLPVLTGWYAGLPFLIFSLFAIGWVAIRGAEKRLPLLFLGWIIPLGAYLIYFIAVKPDHYWLPVMLPLLSGGFMLISYFWERMKTNASRSRWWFYGQGLVVAAIIVWLAYQFAGQVLVGYDLFIRAVNPI